jgi:hypothetical protein
MRVLGQPGGDGIMGDMNARTREPPKGVTFEEVWAMFQENARQLEKMRAETERRIKENERQIGRLGSRLGEVIERLMSPKLQEKFESLGFSFNHVSRNHELQDRDKKRLAEIDVLLENSEYAMAVEVKTRLVTEDIKDHLERMEILRRVADEHDDKRKYMGAVAGAVVDRQVLAYALKNGFYVIVPSGETVDIEAPDGFKPRIWQSR